MTKYKPADYTVVWVHTDDLIPASDNPSKRTTKPAIRALAQSMRDDGWNRYAPVLVSTEGVIGDGNRRYHAAVEVGITEITATFTDMTFAQLIAMNRVSRPFGGRDWLQVYVATDGKVQTPSAIGNQIQKLECVVGREGLVLLTKMNAAPDVWTAAYSVAAYVNRRDNVFLQKLIFWAIRRNMRLRMSEFMKNQGPPAVLIQAVENDLDLKLVFSAEIPT